MTKRTAKGTKPDTPKKALRDLKAPPVSSGDIDHVRGGNIPIERTMQTILEHVSDDSTKDLR